MKLHENFFDLNDPVSKEQGLTGWVKRQFINRCSEFLLKVCSTKLSSTSEAIAAALYARMSDTCLHYHTPVHVLSILDFAKDHQIYLTLWEELAIWFHDAIYYRFTPNSGVNERYSANFMVALLEPNLSNVEQDLAYRAILETSRFMEVQTYPEFEKILDLDVCSFAWERPIYDRVTECLRREFGPSFDQGRKAFLKNFLKKGFVYRTKEFAPFEPLAQENIRKDIEDL